MLTHYNIERKLSTRHMLVGYCTAHSLLFFFCSLSLMLCTCVISVVCSARCCVVL